MTVEVAWHHFIISFGSSQVVDIGSGKGYLSSNLASNHGLKVIGFDSCDVRTSRLNLGIFPQSVKKFIRSDLFQCCETSKFSSETVGN